jgi:NAD(P)H-flavin reductase
VSIDPVTPDMRHVVLELVEPREIKFFPGQYIDITVPGTDETRSFSMANTTCRDTGHLEFVIRVYPDGLFSHFLDTGLTIGRPARYHRPIRGLYPPRGPRQRSDLHRRRRRHGADPVPTAVAGRAWPQP